MAKNREDQPRLKVINERCMQFMVFFFSITESHDLGIKTVLPLQQVFQKISFQQLSNEELNCLIQNKVL